MPDEKIDSLNKQFYLKQSSAHWYGCKRFVMPEEQAFLDDFAPEINHAKLLDMGIGGGRSTRFLFPICGDYLGFDYSPEMIKVAQANFPEAKMEVRDARKLTCYPDGQFDVAFFSFNGLDCILHDGRIQVMSEVQRVLKPGGLFAFSSHNRACAVSKPYELNNLSVSKNPFRMAGYLLAYFKGILSWWKARRLVHQCEEYELRLDSSNEFTAPIYYIGLSAQVQQLKEMGFAVLSVYDSTGHKVLNGKGSPEYPWLFYACRKSSV